MSKIIHDNIWGDIEVSFLALQIIDTPLFQRLHWIRQTGMSFRVFPTSNGSRFEHCIGVYHLIRKFLFQLEQRQDENEIYPPEILNSILKDRRIEIIAIAGLLHDIGHGPFSHLWDEFLQNQSDEQYPWYDHEIRSCLCLERYQHLFSIHEIQLIQYLIHGDVVFSSKNWTITGTWWIYSILKNGISAFDWDKLDYLQRDAHRFGIVPGFSTQRLFENCRIIETKLAFCDKVQDELVQMYLLRNKMHQLIYRHPTIRRFEQEYLTEWKQISVPIWKEWSLEAFEKLSEYEVLEWIPYERRCELDRRCWKIAKNVNIPYRDVQYIKMDHILYFSKKNKQTTFHLPISIGCDPYSSLSTHFIQY